MARDGAALALGFDANLAGPTHIEDCQFTDNQGDCVVAIERASNEFGEQAIFDRCVFSGSPQVMSSLLSQVFMNNCLFAGVEQGFDHWTNVDHHRLSLTNCTMIVATNDPANHAVAAAGPVTISNCIISSPFADPVIETEAELVDMNSTLISGGWAGSGFGNFDADPRFVDPDGRDGDPETYRDNDYRLAADSPAIDAGRPCYLDASPFDLDGRPRLMSATKPVVAGDQRLIYALVDLGAFEYPGRPDIDCDGNGVGDGREVDDCRFGFIYDCNGNRVADVCEVGGPFGLDCNNDLIIDTCEDNFADCNGNGVHDECDISSGLSADCNGNGLLDECDLAAGELGDCDADGVLEVCEPDCDADGVPDDCEIASGDADDCNSNGVPDNCETLPVAFASGRLQPLDADTVHTVVIPNPPRASGTVVLTIDARGDIGGFFSSTVTVTFNGLRVEELFADATPCLSGFYRETITIVGAIFNHIVDLSPDGAATFSFMPSSEVSGAACDGDNWISLDLAYPASPDTDQDGDGVPDLCTCPCDVDQDRVVGVRDFLLLLQAWGICREPCPEDIDADTQVGVDDMLLMLKAFGSCR